MTVPHVALAPEIGWVLAAEAHGKGYATPVVWRLDRLGRSVRDLL